MPTVSPSEPARGDDEPNVFDNRWMEENWYYVTIVVIVFLLCFWALLHYFCRRRRRIKEEQYKQQLMEQQKNNNEHPINPDATAGGTNAKANLAEIVSAADALPDTDKTDKKKNEDVNLEIAGEGESGSDDPDDDLWDDENGGTKRYPTAGGSVDFKRVQTAGQVPADKGDQDEDEEEDENYDRMYQQKENGKQTKGKVDIELAVANEDDGGQNDNTEEMYGPNKDGNVTKGKGGQGIANEHFDYQTPDGPAETHGGIDIDEGESGEEDNIDDEDDDNVDAMYDKDKIAKKTKGVGNKGNDTRNKDDSSSSDDNEDDGMYGNKNKNKKTGGNKKNDNESSSESEDEFGGQVFDM